MELNLRYKFHVFLRKNRKSEMTTYKNPSVIRPNLFHFPPFCTFYLGGKTRIYNTGISKIENDEYFEND